MTPKPTIGLTGGIASGKSSVATILAQHGVGVVDADAIARDIVAAGSDGLREVVEAFGPEILTTAGDLDREALGAVVFGNDEAREKLQRITHPRIAAVSAERLRALKEGSALYVVYEAALLVEVGAHRGLDALIVVAASQDTQIARLHSRNGLDLKQARQRIAAQLPLSDKVAVADYVIDNDGTPEQLEARTLEVHRTILERFALPPRYA